MASRFESETVPAVVTTPPFTNSSTPTAIGRPRDPGPTNLRNEPAIRCNLAKQRYDTAMTFIAPLVHVVASNASKAGTITLAFLAYARCTARL